MRDLENLITNCPALAARLASGPTNGIHSGNGDEAIELASGQRVMFKARTNGGGRGLTGDKVILDEAFALKASHMGSLLPTLSARPDPQVVYGSSAGLPESDVLRAIRDRGRVEGGDPSLAYVEWGAPTGGCELRLCDHALSTPGCALDVEANWYRANPALGRRITIEYVRSERRALPPAEFARERLGWWDESAEISAVIGADLWRNLADLSDTPSPHTGNVVLALDTDPSRARTSIASAGMRIDGLPMIEVIENRPGVDWATARVVEICSRNPVLRVVVDKRSASGSLIEALRAARVPVSVCDAQQMVKACGQFYDAAVETGKLRHLGQPVLDEALRAAVTRPLGDAWAWDRKKPTADITPLTASTLALWGFRTFGAEQFVAPVAYR